MKVRLKDTDLAFNPAEHRDAHGRWTAGPNLRKVLEGHGLKGHGTASGSATDPINTKGNVMLAARLIGEGKNVRVNKVSDIGTLVHDLAAAFKKNPKGTFDLCRVSMPKTNLFCAKNKHIDRIKMPQLSGIPLPGSKAATGNYPRLGDSGEVDLTKAFEASLRSHGVKVDDTTVPVASLKATQDQLVGPKVAGIADFMATAPKDSPVFEPIFVTQDGYVIDGHHRWAAQIVLDSKDGVLGNRPIAVRRVHMDIGEALAAADAFQKDMGLPAEGFTQTKKAVSLSKVRLKDTDLSAVRHVRTAKGAEWYGEPIGSPIVPHPVAPKAPAKKTEKHVIHLDGKAMSLDAAVKLARTFYPWDEQDQRGGGDPASIDMCHRAQVVGRGWYSDMPQTAPADDQYAASLWVQYQNPTLYGKINAILRTGRSQPGDPKPADLWRYAMTMFDKGGYTIDKPMTVYRALKSDKHTDWSKTLTPGTVFTDKGIVSTTPNEHFGEGWLGLNAEGKDTNREKPQDVVVELHLPSGQRIVGGDPGFIETMLPPGTRFKVVSSEQRTTTKAADPLTSKSGEKFLYTRVVAEVVPS